MQTKHRFTRNNLSLLLPFLLLGIFNVGYGEEKKEAIPLVKETGLSHWRAYGAGMLQVDSLGSDGLSISVDWEKTTFGLGAIYEVISEGEKFPDLSEIQKISIEAKSEKKDGTRLAPEWLLMQETAIRLPDNKQPELSDQWQTFTFKIPDDFPKFASQLDAVKALRLLFINKDKETKQGQVSFRNVELIP
ncbi:MAG: hypothetical protein ACK5NG_10020 [Chthoniobacterales bacterium]